MKHTFSSDDSSLLDLIEEEEDIDVEKVAKQGIRKRKRLLSRIFKVASEVLTDRQLQVFVMKYAFEFRSVDIATRLEFSEAYISMVLKICLIKIKKRLSNS